MAGTSHSHATINGLFVLERIPGWGTTRAAGAAVPTGAGFAPGCIFHHLDGGAQTALYVNEGTAVTADFNAVTADLGGLLATADEINRAADVSTRIVSATASTLAVTVALHDNKTVVLNRAAGIAVTLPAALGTGARFKFVVGTAFTGDATIKVNGNPASDSMYGLILGLDGDGVPANAWTVAGTDTITFDGSATPNMTQGGFLGDMYEIEDIATGKFFVLGFVKQTGTEATPMSESVS